ncbi:hypothetical protein [Methanothermococcus sp.]|uniref:hypothetical protein n=1 Tax=Methanothermococcus sp. TaxID=2614238 RepID=UPI0025F6B779|nr:hypothetical protein [Methanothermococcus sp.]
MTGKIIKNETDFLNWCRKHDIDPLRIKDIFLNCKLSDGTENYIVCVEWGRGNGAHYSIVVPEGYHYIAKNWLLVKNGLHKRYLAEV